MAIRPVDLQQVVMKTPDVTRDTAAQQQAATVQQAQTAEVTKRQAQQAETVTQFEEAGAVLIREREGGRRGQERRPANDKDEAGASAENDDAVPQNTTTGRLGRHVDLSA